MWFKRKQRNRRFNRRHVLDVKLRSDQVRAARLRLATTALALFLGTALGLYLFWRAGEWALDRFVYENSEFAIRRIDVQTDGVLAPAQLQRWAGVALGANLIALDLAEVKRNLEMVPAIASVSVERILPHTLKIYVTERRPVAQVIVPVATATGGFGVSVFKLDAAGDVLPPLDARFYTVRPALTGISLPVLTGLNAYQLVIGRRLETPQVQAALRLIEAFRHSPMAGLTGLQSVDVSRAQVIVATTTDGGEITFGLDDLEQQLRRWREIYDLGRRLNRRIAAADLAVQNNVPVRWAEIAAPPAQPDTADTKPSRRKNV